MSGPNDRAAELHSRGMAAAGRGDFESAARDLEQAAVLDPTIKYGMAQALYAAMRCCAWEGWREKCASLLRGLENDVSVVVPLVALSLPFTAEQQFQAARLYAREQGIARVRQDFPPSTPGKKIRIGYFSADFTSHATAHLVSKLFEFHDRSRFEIFAFATAGSANDPARRQIASVVDHFVDIARLAPPAAAAKARALNIDIALDLNVYIDDMIQIFAQGVAPLQINFLGYPGTSATDCYDYLIGDPSVTPPEHQGWYSERFVTLPATYQPNAFQGYAHLGDVKRDDVGLPNAAFVYCCFNDSSKLTPDVFDVWMDLLKSVEGSVLWLLDGGPAVVRNLRTEAQRRGVSPERLVFAPRVPIAEHLARHRAADLFLDTFHYGAHTTASDALWAGLPIVTRLGSAFPGRVAAGLLNAAWLPELVTETTADYAELARTLAEDRAFLRDIRERLEKNRMICPLFDTKRYTRHLEAAYVAMWERYRSGLVPAHIP